MAGGGTIPPTLAGVLRPWATVAAVEVTQHDRRTGRRRRLGGAGCHRHRVWPQRLALAPPAEGVATVDLGLRRLVTTSEVLAVLLDTQPAGRLEPARLAFDGEVLVLLRPATRSTARTKNCSRWSTPARSAAAAPPPAPARRQRMGRASGGGGGRGGRGEPAADGGAGCACSGGAPGGEAALRLRRLQPLVEIGERPICSRKVPPSVQPAAATSTSVGSAFAAAMRTSASRKSSVRWTSWMRVLVALSRAIILTMRRSGCPRAAAGTRRTGRGPCRGCQSRRTP